MTSNVFRLAILSCLVGTISAPVVSAQEAPAAPPQQVQYQEYQIGPGDLLSIQVSGVTQFDLSARVSNSGRVHVPYVGIMLVGGMTTPELEQEIAKQIEAHELVNQPQVRVQVDQHNARPVYVIGEVNNPGQFVITSEMYLLDLVSKAGGLLPSADDKGYLYRRSPAEPSVQIRLLDPAAAATSAATPGVTVSAPEPGQRGEAGEDVRIVDFEALRSGAQPELNVLLQGGDVIFVPRRLQKNFWVIGDVVVPGAYSLPRRNQLTVSQALIYAGGPMPTAKTKSAFIMRHAESGAHEAVEFDFSKILKGEQPDIPIQQNDILYVPTSNLKMVGIGMLNLIPRLLQQYLIF